MRQVVQVFGMFFLLYAFSFLGQEALAGKEDKKGQGSGPEAYEFVTLEKGIFGHSPFGKTTVVAIRSQDQWEGLWSMERHDIDFSKHMVIAAYMGAKPSYGYEIEVEKIQEAGDPKYLHVYLKLINPREDMMLTLSGSSPVHIVRIKQSVLPLRALGKEDESEYQDYATMEATAFIEENKQYFVGYEGPPPKKKKWNT